MIGSFLGIAFAFLSLIDPRLVALGPVAVGLSLLSAWGANRRGQETSAPVAAVVLTAAFALTSWSEPRWCCDATPYYLYVRSALFDFDLDFSNDWAAFGVSNPELTSTGRAINAHSIGPAILWAPFVLLSHLYVLALRGLNLGDYAATGYTAPYLLATAGGTVTAVVAGTLALWRACTQRFSGGPGAVAVVFGLLASTLPYYTFVVPSVAHGPVFAASAFFLAVWLKIEKEPSLKGWLTLAALLGVVSLLRWQAIVLGVMFVPLFWRAWRQKLGRWWWAPAAVLTSGVVLLPQALAWWILFGSPWAAPSQVHGMDWTSPHFIEVLFSADRGLFTWTPVMAFGSLGWLWLARRQGSLAWAAWAILLGTTWVNGGVAIWSGADAFGARRFDLLIPLWIYGLAAGVQAASRASQRRPEIAPACALALLVIWNGGLMRLHRNGVFTEAAPLEELAARQALLLRRTSETWLGHIAGASGRNLAYMMFVGRYFYLNTGFDGRIDLTLVTVPHLSGHWSERMDTPDFGPVRFAFKSESCIKVPIEHVFDLKVAVSVRSVVEGQVMTLAANGHLIDPPRALPMEWIEAPFLVPASLLSPGENLLCLAFSDAKRNGRAAAVRLFQLP